LVLLGRCLIVEATLPLSRTLMAVNTLTNKIYVYEFEHPAIASDIVAFSLVADRLSVLLIRRGLHPFKGVWALPGGFLRPDETVPQCARRELKEETGLIDVKLTLLGIYSQIDRDPRGWVVSTAFYGTLRAADVQPKADTDAAEVAWFSIDELPNLAFDHQTIFEDALRELRAKAEVTVLVARMLPPTFTLTALQTATETVLGMSKNMDKRNFRREVADAPWLKETGELLHGPHRPARLFSIAGSEQ
jgi:8-oxo-dGTP diphosphatase